MIAGLEKPDAGTIVVGDRTLNSETEMVPPERRRIGMVFQDYALFPHLDVARNVAYALGRGGDRKRVEEALELVGLGGYGERSVHQLSGGEQQRVALARALAPGPDLLLLDEPFSNLDASLRERLRSEVRRILNDAGVTTLFVTHDQEEALSLADTVAVMNSGRLEQIGSPEEVYTSPPATGWPASSATSTSCRARSATATSSASSASSRPAPGSTARSTCSSGRRPSGSQRRGPRRPRARSRAGSAVAPTSDTISCSRSSCLRGRGSERAA